MGQCSNRGTDDNYDFSLNAVSIEKARSLSSNAALTSARYNSSRKLTDDYEVDGKVLGSGLCGDVILVRGKIDQRRYALKTIRKQHVPSAKLQQLASEVEIYLALDHPNIARLHNVYEREADIAMVTECCEGGELYFRLQKQCTYSEADAAGAARQMLRAVGYLHAQSIVHRDLKLENFLYESKDPNSQLKLIDFGFAKHWDASTLMTASCGSIAYVSPDVLSGRGYTNKCDLWSLGVIVWMLLSGYPPFHGDEKDMMMKIKAGQADWSHKSRWKLVSEEAIDFLKCLLQKDPSKRPTAQEALHHPWLIKEIQGGIPVSLGRDALRSMHRYVTSSKVRRAVLQFLAQELAPEETKELREAFLAIDRSGQGAICFNDLKDAIRNGIITSPPKRRPKLAEVSNTPVKCPPEEPGTTGQGPYIGEVSALSLPTPMRGLSGSQYGSEAGSPNAMTPAQTLRRASSGSLNELFATLDGNSDERIYYSDFLAATMDAGSAAARRSEEAIQAAFRRLDADGSGTLTASDFKAVMGETFEQVRVEQLFAEADLHEKGEIDYEAFVRIVEDGDAKVLLSPGGARSILIAPSPLRRNLGFYPETREASFAGGA
mmetsp:Transcript_27567/g.82148  ORF Transcript_27567/g.82148 Transcript_27567/m.82148 type:complete len:603 (+) Transcript_27567:84-1892(+)